MFDGQPTLKIRICTEKLKSALRHASILKQFAKIALAF
jgi:hypothetical protein